MFRSSFLIEVFIRHGRELQSRGLVCFVGELSTDFDGKASHDLLLDQVVNRHFANPLQNMR